jgi:uracil-DNA glycosylase family 4
MTVMVEQNAEARMESARAALRDIYAAYADTPILRQISSGRRLVPGAGPTLAPILVCGEAPGEEEERRGEPFVGPSGQLLQELLAGSKVPWGACYRMNVLPWRPPANRAPYPYEIQASYDRVEAEVGVIDPVVIIAAGATAWKGLTRGDHGTFAEARWNWADFGAGRLLAIPHPSAILREKTTHLRQESERATVSAIARMWDR